MAVLKIFILIRVPPYWPKNGQKWPFLGQFGGTLIKMKIFKTAIILYIFI